jgi:uncharacterized 2Fe-2S/4Fe-4S cluster protein (DUF4445 family)
MGDEKPAASYHVIFQPSGKRGPVEAGRTVLDAAREMGVEIESVCGGARACGKCRVRPQAGSFDREGVPSGTDPLSPLSDEEKELLTAEELAQGLRLACAAKVRGDVLIHVPEESRAGRQVVRKELSGRSVTVNPAVTFHPVELSPPTFHDPLADAERLQAALTSLHGLPPLRFDYPVLVKLPSVLRAAKWSVTAVVWMNREIIDVRPGRSEDGYGLAVDVGTTTVAGYLCSLRDGRVVATRSMMNPQIPYGEDVMSRITYAATRPGEGLETLHRAIIGGLNGLIVEVVSGFGLAPEDILEMTLVGNTAMHHLFLKISPDFLGVSPFPPAIHHSLDLKARDLGLRLHPSANLHVLPVEAGFVGADNVGVLLAQAPHRQDEMLLIIDVGTNGELVLGNREKLVSSSCATGPALEGAHIRFGMRAAPGAIERVRIDPGTLEVDYRVIGREPWHSEQRVSDARGICGSGIIDALAELFRAGLVDRTGRFRTSAASPRLRTVEGRIEFVLAWKEETAIGQDITLTQQDVRNVQLAKGALYTGAKLMMERLGVRKVDRVILAGAFGSYIDPERAMILGLFPDCPLERVTAVGNAAGEGARIALLDRDKRAEAEEIAHRVEYLELTL